MQAEGAIYESWDPTVHVVDELPDIDQVLAAGVDYGTTDPFAAVMICSTRDGRSSADIGCDGDPAVAGRNRS